MSLQQGTTAQTRPHFGPPPVGPRPPICWVIPLLPGADSVQSRIHAFFLRVTLRTSQKGLQKQVLKAEWSSLFREAYRFSLDGRGLTRALSTLRTSELQFALRSLRCSGPPRSWIRGLPCTPRGLQRRRRVAGRASTAFPVPRGRFDRSAGSSPATWTLAALVTGSGSVRNNRTDTFYYSAGHRSSREPQFSVHVIYVESFLPVLHASTVHGPLLIPSQSTMRDPSSRAYS